MLAAAFVIAVLVQGCTEVENMNLTAEYTNETGDNITGVHDDGNAGHISSDDESGRAGDAGPADESSGEEGGDDTPLVVDKGAAVYVNPDNLVRKLCPEQVLLGLRDCKKADGSLNVSIKNSGFKNITMVFYFLYDNKEVAQMYFDDKFISISAFPTQQVVL